VRGRRVNAPAVFAFRVLQKIRRQSRYASLPPGSALTKVV